MISKTFTKIFGSRNDRVVKKLFKDVERINQLEKTMEDLSDEALAGKTAEFQQRLTQGESLDDLQAEAFAVVREAGKRVYGMRHYDVQMIGGMVLHQGKIAEMRTGEGKTLVATLGVYLNALSGLGVHVVTVNDYLARRDSSWMGRVYAFLGMSTGVINSSGGAGPDGSSFTFDADYESNQHGMRYLRPVARKEAYACDITYGTNNEFGFDYLRDNMAFSADQRVQRPLNFAVVDEVDSILIDEARTPLIISGPTDDKTDLFAKLNILAPMLVAQKEEEGEGDYWVDEKQRNIILSESGHERAEALMVEHGLLQEGESLYDVGNISIIHHLYAALRAHVLFQRDVHYIISNKEIVIVDEFTGRSMPGRRWSDGLHQAVEAKEGVPIQAENQTLASITFQNYFRMYTKLSGMTGTADTEAFEFQQIYGLDVVVIPTHRPMVRDDRPDQVYLTEREKYNAIALDIQDCIKRGQPVLVGTASIEASELLSDLLNKSKTPHEVLNAKQHEREATIVEQAGRPGSVTIATNMAGRGTDIVLGGNLEAALAAAGSGKEDEIRKQWEIDQKAVLEAGGLHVIGSERHESRRIDNQLRGRSGRQGDPGSSRFYLSLEDSLMRIFASERVSSMMQKLGMEDGEAIEHPWVTKAIENAQRKVEGHNFDIRKNLLEFDDVANDQRRVVYEQRNDLMDVDDVSESVAAIRKDVVNDLVDGYIPPGSIDEQWDVPGLEKALEEEYGLSIPLTEWLEEDDALHEETLREKIVEVFTRLHEEKEAMIGAEGMRRLEKEMTLMVLDNLWKEHLAAMDYLRQGIYLRSYAQKKPQEEYKRESFEMFQQLLERVKTEVIIALVRFQFQAPDDLAAIEEQHRHAIPMEFQHADATAIDATADLNPGAAPLPPAQAEGPADDAHAPFVRAGEKVGRNDPCPCGSGKKYKQCHGKLN